MYQISVSEVLDRAWELFKKHGLVLTVIYLVIEIIASAFGSMGGGSSIDQAALAEAIQNQDWAAISAMNTNYTGGVLKSLVSAVLTLGLVNAQLLLCRGKATSVSFDMWKLPLMTYVKYIVVGVLVGFIIAVGLCLCIIPGIWLGVRLQFAQYRVIENAECGVIEALKQSWEMTKGNTMNLILLIIAQFFIGVVGFILCCIGLIPAAVIVYISSIVAYLTLTGFYAGTEVEEIEA